MWTRVELKTRAKELLSLNYWKAVLVSLIFAFVSGSGGGSGGSYGDDNTGTSDSFSSELFDAEMLELMIGAAVFFIIIFLLILLVSLALSYFVFMPLQVGCHRYFVLCDKNEANMDDVAYVFSHSYMNVVKVMFFYSLYIFLWSLLFVIPGIIKAYEYRMIPYILGEYPDISKEEAFRLTKEMMDGNKWDSFVLDLSFLGWDILGTFTCCILNIFFVNPYRDLTNAQLYLAIKNRHIHSFPQANGSASNPYLQ